MVGQKVYLLVHSWCDTAGNAWEEVIDVYADKTEAELVALESNEGVSDKEYDGYDIHEFVVK